MSTLRGTPLDMLTVIDRHTVAITYPESPVFMELVDFSGRAVFIASEESIRNLRAACDAALGEVKDD